MDWLAFFTPIVLALFWGGIIIWNHIQERREHGHLVADHARCTARLSEAVDGQRERAEQAEAALSDFRDHIRALEQGSTYGAGILHLWLRGEGPTEKWHPEAVKIWESLDGTIGQVAQ